MTLSLERKAYIGGGEVFGIEKHSKGRMETVAQPSNRTVSPCKAISEARVRLVAVTAMI